MYFYGCFPHPILANTLLCHRFIRHALGGPTIAEHDALKEEIKELQAKYDLLLAQHEEACRQVKNLLFYALYYFSKM